MNEYNYVIIDLEMCNIPKKRENGGVILHKEIIQIGAVFITSDFMITDSFSVYVRPRYGQLDPIITEITGITPDKLKKAPFVEEAIGKFCKWIGGRKVHILSWSDSDYRQIREEMSVKEIFQAKMTRVMEEWVDFQKCFGNMMGAKSQISLQNALAMVGLTPLGKNHDGFHDAYNTARLFLKLREQDRFVLHLDTLRSGANTIPDPEPWTWKRKIMSVFHGKEMADEFGWRQYLLKEEFKKRLQ